VTTAPPEEIRTQLVELGFMSKQAIVDDDQPLFDSGVLDSLRLIELVSRLEGRFGIHVGIDDLVPENFGSIVGMSRYVDRVRHRQS
jgi:acyl carrier protein